MDHELTEEQQIVAAIRQIVRAVDLHSRRLLETHGLTGPQLATLQEAMRLEAASPSTLARAVHVGPATMTGILQRLERRGLVVRTRSDTDRRSVRIEVTEAGRRLLESEPSLLQVRFREALERLEPWERLLILSTLQRVASLMGAADLPVSPHLMSETAPLEDPPDEAHGSTSRGA